MDIKSADSEVFFVIFRKFWKILGMDSENVGYKSLYIFYGIFLNVLITCCYPFHLLLALFSSASQSENFKNLGVCVTVTSCSLKFAIYILKFEKIRKFQLILKQLDVSVKAADELEFFKQLRNNARNITYIFLSVYFPACVVALLSLVFKSERGLLYQAWFPFDWRENAFHYYLASGYQAMGLCYLLLENYVNDCFPAVAFCILSGQAKLLALRIAKIGYDDKSTSENEEILLGCIKDHKKLYELFDTIQELISLPMFIQFCATGVNICVAMVALLYYGEAPLDRLYSFVYFLAMTLQIFPTCYYGSDFQYYFGRLHHAAFSSNWSLQTPKFKKHLMMFVERTLRLTHALAGGMLRIHLDTFFATWKFTYSLFTVIMRIKK